MLKLRSQVRRVVPSRGHFDCRRFPALALAILGLASPAFPASFTASLDRDTVTVGETVTLTLKFEGGTPKAIPSPPPIPNLQVVNAGNSRNISIDNGQFTSSISQNFELTPAQPGEFTIPALQAEVDGRVLTSQALKFRAVKAGSAATGEGGNQLAFMRLVIPKKEVFLGEVLVVELQVYIRDGVANAEGILRSFDSYNASPVKAEGFSVLKTAHAQRRRAQAGGGAYTVATLVTALTPVKTGNLTLGSFDPSFVLQLPLPGQRRRDPFFDPFGMFQQYQEKRVTLTADPVTLTALELPKQNVPPNFNGAIGSFSLAVTAGPTNVAAGDPVTVRVQISGRGAFDSLTLPDQPAWRDFKSYPPTTKIDTTDPLGLQGAKTFEQVVVPQTADIKALPPISFSFFDPDQKAYRNLTQPAIPLLVRPGGAVPAPTVAATARGASDSPPPAQDIVGIKTRLGTVAQITPPLVQQTWFLALQGLPLLALISSIVWRKRAELLANNPRLRRQRRVQKILRDGLTDLRRLAAEKKSDDFFALLFRLLQEQLGERLDLPATAITEAVIEDHLRPRGVSDPTLAALQELFQTCNLARYAPVKTSQELAAVVPKLEAVLRSLQELKL